MISSVSPKKISILITTYRREKCHKKLRMDEKHMRKGCKSSKYICAICLNTKSEEKSNECNKKPFKFCPMCQKSCDYCQSSKKDKSGDHVINVKDVQTSDTNVAQGLNLLNEVLTVFQNNKVDSIKDKSKTALRKDAGVCTEDERKIKKDPSRLTVSSFYYSIDQTKKPENGKFTIVCSCQPDFIRKSQHSIDLIKHKSSSIPQMKLEELKHSLKEKTRSKDAIEEVNRMFATVRKSSKSLETSNRPSVRSGPRVLPVVKNLVHQDVNNVNVESGDKGTCKCCQTCMSSGDSFIKTECCHDCHDMEETKTGKCVYMMCCHYQKRKMQSGMLCENCRNLSEDFHCEHDNH